MKILRFFNFLAPDEASFVQHFEEVADNLIQCSELMKKLMLTETVEEREALIDKIKLSEKEGDRLTVMIIKHLNKSFLTPFDREDIQELTAKLDDVVNNVYAASQRIRIYKPRKLTKEMYQVSEIMGLIALEIRVAVGQLHHAIDHKDGIIKSCDQINMLENKADHVYNMAISMLFEQEPDTIELIKTKEIMHSMEKAADMAEDVSDVIRTILLKLT